MAFQNYRHHDSQMSRAVVVGGVGLAAVLAILFGRQRFASRSTVNSVQEHKEHESSLDTSPDGSVNTREVGSSLNGSTTSSKLETTMDPEDEIVAPTQISSLLSTSPRAWEDPLVQGFNKERPRPTLCAFSSVVQARANVEIPEVSDNVLTLDGVWRFSLHVSPEEALATRFHEVGFREPQTVNSTGVPGGSWDNTPVPSCWQMQVTASFPGLSISKMWSATCSLLGIFR
ncbi:unnamed protein product [Choristocarpus tenellus]